VPKDPGPETVFVDDVVNADWPKQTDDTHEAIQARIDAELRAQGIEPWPETPG
jgi:hypothetical protein